MQVLFIRHGESTDDIDDRYGGWGDFHLTAKGKKQIKSRVGLVRSLGVDFEKIYSSPLLRASESASVLSEGLGIPFEIFEYVKEKNGYGLLSGMVKSEAKNKYPDQVRKLESRAQYVDGSVRHTDFVKRVKRSVQLMKKFKEDNVVVVTHGGYLKCVFEEVFGKNVSNYNDGGFALVEIKENKSRVLTADGIDLD